MKTYFNPKDKIDKTANKIRFLKTKLNFSLEEKFFLVLLMDFLVLVLLIFFEEILPLTFFTFFFTIQILNKIEFLNIAYVVEVSLTFFQSNWVAPAVITLIFPKTEPSQEK